MEKAEFCWNSRRWIELMVLRLGAPDTCPNQKMQLTKCEECGYYEMREPTKYLLYIRKVLMSF